MLAACGLYSVSTMAARTPLARRAGALILLAGLGLAAAGGSSAVPPPPPPKLPPIKLPTGVPKFPGLPCTVKGSAGPNIIRGVNRRPEILCGRRGNDTIYAGPGDIVLGGQGNDTIYARNGKTNLVDGGAGADRARVDRKIDLRSSVERLF